MLKYHDLLLTNPYNCEVCISYNDHKNRVNKIRKSKEDENYKKKLLKCKKKKKKILSQKKKTLSFNRQQSGESLRNLGQISIKVQQSKNIMDSNSKLLKKTENMIKKHILKTI